MYSQGLIGADTATVEDEAFLDAFQARIDAEEKIEPKDWMPEAYRQHADPADLPARPFRNRRHAAGRQLDHPRADARRKAALLAKVQDEGGHGLYLYCRRRDAWRLARGDGRAAAGRQGQVFLDFQLSDADLGRYRRHRLAGRRRGDHEPDPDLPLLLRPLCARDDAHLQGGELSPAPGLRDHDDACARHAEQKAMAQDALEPLVVAIADDVRPARCDSQHAEQSMRWKIKRFTNDELRQKFVDATVPQAEYLGLKVPDPDLAWNEARPALRFRRHRLGRVPARGEGRRPVQSRAPRRAPQGARATAPGCARPPWRTPPSSRAAAPVPLACSGVAP